MNKSKVSDWEKKKIEKMGMGISVKLNNCKCGKQEKIWKTRSGWWIYCSDRRWYNFWKHRPKTQHGWFPY